MPPCAYGHVQLLAAAFVGRGPLRPPRHGRRGRLPARRLVADERRLRTGRPRLLGARQQRHAGRLGRRRRSGPGLDPRRLRRLGAAASAATTYVPIPDSSEPRARQADGRGLDPRQQLARAVQAYVVAKGATGCASGSYGLYTGDNGGLAFYIGDGTQNFCARPRRRPRSGTASGTTPRARSTARRCASSSTATRSATALPATSTPIELQPARGRRRHRRLPRHRATCSSSATSTACRSGRSALPVDDIWRFLKALFSTSR